MLTIKQKRLLGWLKIASNGGAKYEVVPFSEFGMEHDALDFVCNAGYTVVRVPEKSRFEVLL